MKIPIEKNIDENEQAVMALMKRVADALDSIDVSLRIIAAARDISQDISSQNDDIQPARYLDGSRAD